jgi:membrane protein
VIAVAVTVSGPLAKEAGKVIGVGDTAVMIWDFAKIPLILIMVSFLFAFLYWAAPNVKQPKFRWLTPGGALALFSWIVASAGFALYVANFGSYSKTYGALGGVVVFLVWLWITNLAILFGAEVNAEIERGRQLQSGMPAEEELQLPAKDTKKIEKSEKKEAEELEEARALRESHGARDAD